ncbi:MAG: NTP transferase domain-containing protein [Sulfolobales archaeon]|nr:NTP transferase domain-containing protein [Sulfolobales archaeon]MCX8208330.1 NTP transferase domain-containing protein [Sulfolobales archaeon]MDW8010667.1 NTP transferase domain-containing protein [Sulfolobales archaeon]
MRERRVTCLLLAGGAGTRFGDPAKFLRDLCGESIASRLIRQLEELCEYVVIALSHRTIDRARALCENPRALCVELPGSGYVDDLSLALRSLPKPVLTVAADVVARDSVIRNFLENALLRSVDVVTAVVEDSPGWQNPVGLALFNREEGSWDTVVLDAGDVVDVDTEEDLEKAGRFCG